jgi:hypothetical protein
MKTTIEIQNSNLEIDKKAIVERLGTMKNIWNVLVDTDKALISFEYLNESSRDFVKRELHQMGYILINDTHSLDSNVNPH